jgi:uncharacterized protein (DUF1330 family)
MSEARKTFEATVTEALARVADGQPLVMINLLRYREAASYPAGFDAAPCSGSEAYRRYGHAAIRFITEVGGQVIWQGSAKAMLIGPRDEQWHKALLVRYPSKQAFLSMVSNPDYQAITVHRSAALEDSRLIATVPAE